MLQDILFALFFFWPAGVSNGAPVVAAKIRALDWLGKPIDGGRTYRGKRIFGNHKTWRGLIVGVIFAVITAGVQMILYNNFEGVQTMASAYDYSQFGTLLLGAALGFGALAGDAVKSFFKRQAGVASGKTWFPFDQTDYIIGGILCSLPFVVLDTRIYAYILGLWFGTHLVVVYVFWKLGVREAPI